MHANALLHKLPATALDIHIAVNLVSVVGPQLTIPHGYRGISKYASCCGGPLTGGTTNLNRVGEPAVRAVKMKAKGVQAQSLVLEYICIPASTGAWSLSA